jgi:hypothetical protein
MKFNEIQCKFNELKIHGRAYAFATLIKVLYGFFVMMMMMMMMMMRLQRQINN